MSVKVRLASTLDLGGLDLVKVRCYISTSQRDLWPEIKRKVIEELEVTGCEVSVVQAVLEQRELARVQVKTYEDDKALVKQYGKSQSLSPGVLVTGYELLSAA